MTTTANKEKTCSPRGQIVRSSWYEQSECSENEMLADSESASTEDDTTSCSSDSSEHCGQMTIDDTDSDQLTMASATSEPINMHRKRQTSVESYPSSSLSSDVPSQSNTKTSTRNQFERKLEMDADILARREKQIQYGKNSASYKEYIKQVPREKRTRQHPKTPPKHYQYSRRSFDAMVRIWRKQLHNYDHHNQVVIKENDKDKE